MEEKRRALFKSHREVGLEDKYAKTWEKTKDLLPHPNPEALSNILYKEHVNVVMPFTHPKTEKKVSGKEAVYEWELNLKDYHKDLVKKAHKSVEEGFSPRDAMKDAVKELKKEHDNAKEILSEKNKENPFPEGSVISTFKDFNDPVLNQEGKTKFVLNPTFKSLHMFLVDEGKIKSFFDFPSHKKT